MTTDDHTHDPDHELYWTALTDDAGRRVRVECQCGAWGWVDKRIRPEPDGA